MSKLNDYLKKTRKPLHEAMRPSDYDSPEQQKEEEEMMGEIPWFMTVEDGLGTCTGKFKEINGILTGTITIHGIITGGLKDPHGDLEDALNNFAKTISID